MTKRIIFSVDNLLTSSEVRNEKQVAFFKKHGAVITLNKTYCVFPGVIETLKGVFAEPDTRVGFYIHPRESIDPVLIDRILILALGEAGFAAVKTNELVTNKLVHALDKEEKEEFDAYGKHCLVWYKDLTAICPKVELPDCVLVDTDYELALPGQSPNLLYVPWTTVPMYTENNADKDDGKILLPCFLSLGKLTEYESLELSLNRHILVERKDKLIVVHYLDSATMEPRSDIFQGTSEITAALLNCTNYELRHPFDQAIHEWVEKKGGVTTHLGLTMNRIYYAAGMIFSALQESRETGIPISEILLNRQFVRIVPGKFKPLHRLVGDKEKYYHLGLAALRKFNADLQFMTPNHYKAFQITA